MNQNILIIVGVIGAFTGARITGLYVPSNKVKQIFGVLILMVTLYKIYTLIK